jgi:hypothetical protein
MIPPTILRQLNRLRRRERALRLIWAVTLAVAVLAAVLLTACLIDWIIDLRQETPLQLRYAMLGIQIGMLVGALIAIGYWSFNRRLSDDDLALYVESKAPTFDHRLISALQLNRPGADTKGMSPTMIAATTKQAEEQANQASFASLADHSRLGRAAKVGLVVASVAVILALVAPETMKVLLARQVLLNREIPRNVQLTAMKVGAWPIHISGEEVVLGFKVSGKFAGSPGQVTIYPKDGPSETYPLVFERHFEGSDKGTALYTATIRPTSVNYDYRAWLQDGRSREPLQVKLEPRPAVAKLEAFVQLPKYVGLKPDRSQYEMPQPRGDIAGLPGASARIAIETNKPLALAIVDFMGRMPPELVCGLPGPIGATPGVPLGGVAGWLTAIAAAKHPEVGAPGGSGSPIKSLIPEQVVRRIKMKLDYKTLTSAELEFDLRPEEYAYQITLMDRNRFLNIDPPRRSIRMESEEPPTVALLPERFAAPGKSSTEDDEVEGVPILHRGKFRVAYTSSSPYGLGKAVLRYRVNEEGDWLPLPLKEVRTTDELGPFDLKQGAFVASKFLDEVEFHRIPSPDPNRFPSGTEGGGRLDFKTAGLGLKVGDKLEFFLEVYDRNPDVNRAPGKSEVRQKTVVDLDGFLAWRESIQQEEARIRQLENRQRDVFGSSLVTDTTPPSGGGTRIPVGLRPSNTFVRNWQIIGPFPNDESGKGFDTAYPPEQEKTPNLGAEHDGIKGKIRWKAHHSPGDKIDLEAFLKHSDAGVAYARCWFRANDEKAVLATGSDDGIKVWIDGKEVLSRKLRRDAVPGEDKTPIKLNDADWHEMLVKIDNRTASWAFYLELLEEKGNKPLDGLQFRTTPPGEDEKRFVREWLLIGAFPNVGDKGRDKPWPPETDPVDLEKEYDGIAGKVKWKEHKSETGRIGFDKFFERPFNESNLAYAVCWVKSDRDRTATLATGSDDGIKVWVNRKLRIDAAVSREAEPGKDIQSVPLKKGWNELLVKVDNRFGRWAFYLELRDPDTERPLEELTFSTTPPKE